MKRRTIKKRHKVIWQTQFGRAVTSYESCGAANEAAKALRASSRKLAKSNRAFRGKNAPQVLVVPE